MKRERSETDRRVVYIMLTAKGNWHTGIMKRFMQKDDGGAGARYGPGGYKAAGSGAYKPEKLFRKLMINKKGNKTV